MSDKQYANRDIIALDENGGHYHRHMNAMTHEQLYSKSGIAAELAYRDHRISQIEKERDALKEKVRTAMRDMIYCCSAHAMDEMNNDHISNCGDCSSFVSKDCPTRRFLADIGDDNAWETSS